jgi:hypothetical protein
VRYLHEKSTAGPTSIDGRSGFRLRLQEGAERREHAVDRHRSVQRTSPLPAARTAPRLSGRLAEARTSATLISRLTHHQRGPSPPAPVAHGLPALESASSLSSKRRQFRTRRRGMSSVAGDDIAHLRQIRREEPSGRVRPLCCSRWTYGGTGQADWPWCVTVGTRPTVPSRRNLAQSGLCCRG